MCKQGLMRITKRPLHPAVLISLLLSLALSSLTYSKETYTIGGITELSAPPYIWIDDCSKTPLGTSAHFIREIFNRLELDYNYAPIIKGQGSIKAFEDEIVEKNYDVLIGVVGDIGLSSITTTKAPIAVLKSGLITRTDTLTAINSIEQLKDYKGSISRVRRLSLSALDNNMIEENQLQLTEVTLLSTALDRLLEGKVDYVIGSKYPMMMHAEKIKKRDAFNFTLIPEISINFYLGINNASSLNSHLSDIDSILASISAERSEYLERSYLIRWLDDAEPCNNKPSTSN